VRVTESYRMHNHMQLTMHALTLTVALVLAAIVHAEGNRLLRSRQNIHRLHSKEGFGGRKSFRNFAKRAKNVGKKKLPARIDCQGNFGPFSDCIADNGSCGPGKQIRTYAVATNRTGLGKRCPHETGYEEEKVCNAEACLPVHCEVVWGLWSSCDKLCGGGVQYRSRTTRRAPLHGGTACPPPIESRACNKRACNNVDCDGNWSAWSKCSRRCDRVGAPKGIMTKTFTVSKTPVDYGKKCPDPIETLPCGRSPCYMGGGGVGIMGR
jgi:hypothetical protein